MSVAIGELLMTPGGGGELAALLAGIELGVVASSLPGAAARPRSRRGVACFVTAFRQLERLQAPEKRPIQSDLV